MLGFTYGCGEHLETCLMLPEQHPKFTVKVLDKFFARSFEQKFYGFSGPLNRTQQICRDTNKVKKDLVLFLQRPFNEDTRTSKVFYIMMSIALHTPSGPFGNFLPRDCYRCHRCLFEVGPSKSLPVQSQPKKDTRKK